MSKEYVFLMVALVDELEKVFISTNKIDKLYDVYKFVIVVPQKDLDVFKNRFRLKRNVHIINENLIVNKDKFYDLCNKYLGNNKDFGSFRKNWYYQQVLKLTYALNDQFFSNHNFVMWDADTIPIRKIKFFNKKNEPINYGSFYEYHQPYFEHNKIVFGKQYIPFNFAATIQFFALNLQDRRDLRELLLKFNVKNNISKSDLFVGDVILKGIQIQHKGNSIKGQLVSEQELVGAFIFQKYNRFKKDQKLIKFFRFDVDGYLSAFQNLILFIFNYKHVTYESYFVLKKKQTYKHLIKALIRDNIVRNNRSYNKFNHKINLLKNFLGLKINGKKI